jgi:hypothetical protein
MAEKRGTGVRLLFRPFLLATQEKGARSLASETALEKNEAEKGEGIVWQPRERTFTRPPATLSRRERGKQKHGWHQRQALEIG